MSEQVIQQSVKFSFIKKFSFYFKVNTALKDCIKIEANLVSNDYLSKFDSRLNLIISDGSSNEVTNTYFINKTYNPDGSTLPIRKHAIIDGEIEEYINVIEHNIIVVDLYEESTYLHSYSKNSRYITGYLIKEELISETNKTLIFSNEKVKINIKNINKFESISVVDDFINNYIM